MSERDEGRSEFDVSFTMDRDTTEAGVYPIALVSYHIVCLQYSDQAKADLVKSFMAYVGSEAGQEAAAEAAGSAPLSPAAAWRRSQRPSTRSRQGDDLRAMIPPARGTVGAIRVSPSRRPPAPAVTEALTATVERPTDRPVARGQQARRPDLRRPVQGRRDPDPGRAGGGRRVPGRRRRCRRSPSGDFDESFLDYVGPLVFGTIWAAFLALVIATPLAMAVALFTTPLRAAPVGVAARVLHRPAGGRAERRVRPVGVGGVGPGAGPQRVPVARGQPRVHPVVQGPGGGERSGDDDRRRRAWR